VARPRIFHGCCDAMKHRTLFRCPLQELDANCYLSAVGAEDHPLVLFRPFKVRYRLDRNESGQQKKILPVSTTGSCIGRGASDCHRVRSGSPCAIAGAFLGGQTRGVHAPRTQSRLGAKIRVVWGVFRRTAGAVRFRVSTSSIVLVLVLVLD
jgi:hypothetical protein